MTHRNLGAHLLIALAATACAQPKPDWPQPIIKGSLVVWGGEEAKAPAMEQFVRLAGDGQILVVSSTADTARATWAEVEKAKVVSLLSASDIGRADSVWLDSFFLGNDEMIDGFEALKKRGGTVGLSAESFATGRFSGLMPYVTASQDEDGTAEGPLQMTMDEGAVLVLRGRFMRGAGEGKTTFRLAAGAGKEATDLVLNNRSRLDLVSIRRRAIDRTMAAFPIKRTPDVKSGSLMIVGGGGMPGDMVERFIELAGGPDAKIVYVPCTFAEEIAREPGFVRMLRSRGAKNVTWIHTKDRVKADTDEEFLAPLKDAGGVWFGGGRQWNLVDSYMDTKAHELMWDVLARGGVIGGSSAGASIQAEFLARGDPLGNTNIIAPGYLRGLGFLPGVAVDQHFTQRGRQKDMTELMLAFPQVLGIGIDESTAIIVRRTVAEVLGTGAVHFYDYTVTPSGETDYVRLESGKRYDLAARQEIRAR
ncbi:MAG: cyanophycinase [Armatimonadetes bacterium]|nr:cyanophycinase [Armatimonadota bacterium]